MFAALIASAYVLCCMKKGTNFVEGCTELILVLIRRALISNEEK